MHKSALLLSALLLSALLFSAAAQATPRTFTVDARDARGALRLDARTSGKTMTVTATAKRGAFVVHRAVQLTFLRCTTTACARTTKTGSARRTLKAGKAARSVKLTTASAPALRVQVVDASGRTLRRGVLLSSPQSTGGTGSGGNDPSPLPPGNSPPEAYKLAISSLTPGYSESIADYTTACEPAGTARVDLDVPAGDTFNLNGQTLAPGAYQSTLALHAGQAFTFQHAGGQAHTVRCTPANFPTWTVQRNGTPQSQWLVIAPFGGSYGSYSIITDSDGVPVWWKAPKAGVAIDAKLLDDGTVAWADGSGGFAQSQYEHVTLSGAVLPDITGVGVGSDHHDLQVLPNGNRLLITYRQRAHADLSSQGGPADITVLDAEIQEVTPAGDLAWSWNSKDHIGLDETSAFGLANTQTTFQSQPAYDIIHMNSIQQVDDSTVLFSARHLNAVYLIDKNTGAVIWKLGGTTTPQSLTFVNDPLSAASFGGQHFARILPDGTLTVHDNGTGQGRPPRAVRYSIDANAHTATLLDQVTDSRATSSGCCGSSTKLPTGNWVMAWGQSPLITEMTPSGDPVLTLRLASGLTYRVQPLGAGVLTRAQLHASMNTLAAGAG